MRLFDYFLIVFPPLEHKLYKAEILSLLIALFTAIFLVLGTIYSILYTFNKYC